MTATVVALHGITEDSRSWELADFGPDLDIIALDVLGHGSAASLTAHTLDQAVDDVHCHVAALALPRAPVLMGHALGGLVATMYASRFPVRAVVSVEQPLDIEPLSDRDVSLLRSGDTRRYITTLFSALYGDLDPILIGALAQIRYVRRQVLLRYWQSQLFSEREIERWVRMHCTLDAVPYLSVHGFEPGARSDETLHALVPGAEVHRTGVQTHYPHLAAPAEFAAIVCDFLERRAPQDALRPELALGRHDR